MTAGTIFDKTRTPLRVWLAGARHLRDPKLMRTVHRSQNGIESYHQLRAAIAQVGRKKELTGRTDLDIEISNQCGQLIANANVYYNSANLSRLLQSRSTRQAAIRTPWQW